MRCEDEKMFYRPPLLEEPCAQTLSGKTPLILKGVSFPDPPRQKKKNSAVSARVRHLISFLTIFTLATRNDSPGPHPFFTHQNFTLSVIDMALSTIGYSKKKQLYKAVY